jgi:8-oxo-dGTP diphosphatase
MHWIQRHILYQLMLTECLQYSKLKPDGVEGNLFMYHLRQLMNEGLVEKKEQLYCLSTAGRAYVDTLSLSNLRPRVQPKIVTLIALRNDSGQWLLYRRKRQPFIGKVGFPYGKIHLSETIAEAARRELEEKTGLQAALTHVGDAYITATEGGQLISHMLTHVFTGRDPRGELIADSEIGACYWANIEQIKPGESFPGFRDLYGLVSIPSSERFFREFQFDLPAGSAS